MHLVGFIYIIAYGAWHKQCQTLGICKVYDVLSCSKQLRHVYVVAVTRPRNFEWFLSSSFPQIIRFKPVDYV